MLAHLWQEIPDPLRDPVALAAPFFLLFIALESLAAVLLEDEDPRRYDRADAMASIGAGAVSAPSLRDKLGHVCGPPGWRPATASERLSAPVEA